VIDQLHRLKFNSILDYLFDPVTGAKLICCLEEYKWKK
jgi:hypothetical protein